MRRLLAAALLLLLVAAPVAARPSSLAFVTGYTVIQQPVEQESPNFFDNNCGGDPGNPACDPTTWVYNPTGCAWDLDDTNGATGVGQVLAGDTVSGSACIIADQYHTFGGDPHEVEVNVVAQSSDLTVRLSNSNGLSWLASAVREGNGFRWIICIVDPTPGPYPVVPDSNGGTGIRVDYTLSLTASRNVKGVNAILQTGFTGIYNLC